MTPEELLAAVDVLAEAPVGIAQLRRLILRLAVHGRLVPQDAREGSGSTLLENLPAEVARLAASRLVRKVERFPQPLPGSLCFNLPSNWSIASLGNVALVLDHLREPVKAAERESRCVGKPQASLYPYFGATQQQGWIDDYRLEGEFVLLGEDGVPFLDPLRDKAYLVSGRVWVNNHAHVLLGVQFSNRFLLHYLNQFDYSGRVTGTTRAKLTKGDLLDIPVPVPPLAEQHRIVARVEELMGLLDRLEAARAKRDATRAAARDSVLNALREADSPAAVDAAWTRFAQRMDDLVCDPADIPPLRQTVLQLAVRGRLVRQDPEDEPVANFAQPSATPRRTSRGGGPGDSVQGLFGVPESWRWLRMDAITELASGVTKGRNLAGRSVSSLPYLRVANVQAGHLDLEIIKTIDVPHDEIDEGLLLQPGDVLLTEGGDWDKLGRSAIWSGEINRCTHQNHVFRARPLGAMLPRWISMFTNSPDGRTYFQTCAKRTTNLASINMTQLRACPVPVPPFAEQRRIVAHVDELMALLDRLEQRLTSARSSHAAFAAAAVHHLET